MVQDFINRNRDLDYTVPSYRATVDDYYTNNSNTEEMLKTIHMPTKLSQL